MKFRLWIIVMVSLALTAGMVSYVVATGENSGPDSTTESPMIEKEAGTSLQQVAPAGTSVSISSLACYVDGEKYTTVAGDTMGALHVDVHSGAIVVFSAKVKYNGPAKTRGTVYFTDVSDSDPDTNVWQAKVLTPGILTPITFDRPWSTNSGGSLRFFAVHVRSPDGVLYINRIFEIHVQ